MVPLYHVFLPKQVSISCVLVSTKSLFVFSLFLFLLIRCCSFFPIVVVRDQKRLLATAQMPRNNKKKKIFFLHSVKNLRSYVSHQRCEAEKQRSAVYVIKLFLEEIQKIEISPQAETARMVHFKRNQQSQIIVLHKNSIVLTFQCMLKQQNKFYSIS